MAPTRASGVKSRREVRAVASTVDAAYIAATRMREPEMPAKPRVAIACQGGGSHAAFAAGVLLKLLAADMRDRFELAALSGTSGGAICASLAWGGMLRGGHEQARARLERFWYDLEVHDLLDAAVNFWSVWLARLPVSAEVSPYAYEPLAESALRALLEKHLDLESLDAGARGSLPKLFVGATDIQSGDRVIFDGEGLTYDQVVASAAVPPIFRAVETEGRLYWDGLFSTNPPVREFTDLAERPDEIWVVQINPQHRSGEPRSVRDIEDRRNELAGNLSLGQELYFIDRINQLLVDHATLRAKYRKITIRVVELGLTGLDYPSKLDRSANLIERLIADGKARAGWFFSPRSLWPREGSVPARAMRVGRRG
jgi:NTE family protein